MNKSKLRKKAKENGWSDAEIFQMFSNPIKIRLMTNVPKSAYTLSPYKEPNKDGKVVFK
tara:strand:- start:388 stop:564 length:177 start_codon:yes stop_codon:yes gene_type:complete